jgi:hypothetical protein
LLQAVVAEVGSSALAMEAGVAAVALLIEQ